MRRAAGNLYILVLAVFLAATAAAAVPVIVGADQPFAGASDSVKSPNLPSISSPDLATLAADRLSSGNLAKALADVKPDASHATRGAQSVAIYKKFSRSVVLILRDDRGVGSGSLIDTSGDILTNWHVVEGARELAVVFKPKEEGGKIDDAEAWRGEVIKVDEVADLALVHIGGVPAGVAPIPLGALKDVEVGADVHAIGHPNFKSWSYTQGVVSQIRRDYDWVYDDKSRHHGTVIQTQTPINPGNSGGPLISSGGTLIGVNSFGDPGFQGLNFAVAVDEVARFLASRSSRSAPEPVASRQDGQCEPRETYRGRNKENTGGVIGYDMHCTGKTTGEFRYPDDPSLPYTAVFDRNEDGKLDLIIYDFSRTEHWQLSLSDERYDGSWNLVGHHTDGTLKAAWYESYDQYLTNGGRPLKR